MKLEVGMYVRFKDKKGITYIRKITKLANEYPQRLYGMEIDVEANYSPYLSLKNILKASHNIIDLIEVGDYVNGQLVNELLDNVVLTGTEYIPIKNEDIETIVTKEQFEAMAYKVV
jgi:hypothetical protein